MSCSYNWLSALLCVLPQSAEIQKVQEGLGRLWIVNKPVMYCRMQCPCKEAVMYYFYTREVSIDFSRVVCYLTRRSPAGKTVPAICFRFHLLSLPTEISTCKHHASKSSTLEYRKVVFFHPFLLFSTWIIVFPRRWLSADYTTTVGHIWWICLKKGSGTAGVLAQSQPPAATKDCRNGGGLRTSASPHHTKP